MGEQFLSNSKSNSNLTNEKMSKADKAEKIALSPNLFIYTREKIVRS